MAASAQVGLRQAHGCPGLARAARCGPFGVACHGEVGAVAGWVCDRWRRYRGGMLGCVGGGGSDGLVVFCDRRLSQGITSSIAFDALAMLVVAKLELQRRGCVIGDDDDT